MVGQQISFTLEDVFQAIAETHAIVGAAWSDVEKVTLIEGSTKSVLSLDSEFVVEVKP